MLGDPPQSDLISTSLPGIDFDSQGRAFGDVEEFNSVGQRQTVRRELTEDEALLRLNADVDTDLATQQQAADDALAQQQAAGELPSLDDASMYDGPSPYEVSHEQTSATEAKHQQLGEDLSATVTTSTPNTDYGLIQESNDQMQGSPDPFPVAPWDPASVQNLMEPYDPGFDREKAIEAFQPPPRMDGETVTEWNSRQSTALAMHTAKVDDFAHANMLAGIHNELTTKWSQEAHAEATREIRLKTAQSNDPAIVTGPGGKGIAQAKKDTEKNIATATNEQTQVAADGEQRYADATRKNLEVLGGMIDRQEAQLEEIGQAQQTIMDARAKMQEKMQAMPAPDSRRFFKNMSGGQKFWMMLGAIGHGLAGHNDSVKALYKLADNDYQEQLAGIDKARGDIASMDEQGNHARAMFREMRASIGDSVALQHEWRAMLLDDAAATTRAEIAQTEVPLVKARLEKLLIATEQAANAERMASESRARKTPKNFVRTRNKLTGGARDVAEAEFKRTGAEINDARQREPTLLNAAEDRVGKLLSTLRTEKREDDKAAAALKEARAHGPQGAEGRADAAVSDVRKYIAAIDQMDKFYTEHMGKNIAGRGASAYFLTQEGRETKVQLQEIATDLLYADSGAVVGDDEKRAQLGAQVAGWGDEQLLGNIQREMERAAAKVNTRFIPLSDEALALVHSGMRRAGFNVARYGRTGKSAAQVATELGGTVE